ncbi:uncharacterized protein LY89DRAFT_666417 [Mollisia scopiformis]|uniref:Uncharacterized protein n=1 Tax=Mollisia scopiformis TaxID=149040 RepID=A0A194XKP0_MOLSC|nr:uncharacterized protein LY89DRAFT_666417 [Mollisia scopiformis]KUJ20780.1 hypothetical protein LY89DRAFT_666417 [Mollisia scopiformis]
MFSCCGQRQKKNATAKDAQLSPNTKEPATNFNRDEINPNTDESSNGKQKSISTGERDAHEGGAADNTVPETFEPLSEEFDLNSSIFMPDPSKRKPSAFELASASYAEATDFDANKEQLPSMTEHEEEEEEEEVGEHHIPDVRGKVGDENVHAT